VNKIFPHHSLAAMMAAWRSIPANGEMERKKIFKKRTDARLFA